MSQKHQHTHHQSKRKLKVLGIISAVLVAFIAFYTIKSVQYKDVFLPKTTVAGVNISGNSIKQANAKLIKHFDKKQFSLLDDEKQLLTFTGKEAGVNHNFEKLLTSVKNNQKPWQWSFSTFAKASDKSASGQITLDSTTFNMFFDSIKGDINAGRTASTNAYIANENGAFSIVKETQGNTFDETSLKKTIQTAVNSGTNTIQLKDLYVKPTIKSTDKVLSNNITEMNKIAKETITYTINGYTEVVPSATLFTWISNTNGKVTLNNQAVASYVATLATKYNTYSKTRSFKSTKRGTVSVPAGIYGWSIDQEKEVAALTTEVLKGESFTREPVIVGTGYNKNQIDIPNTYIEVDLVNQHMWYYKNGVLILDTDVVTGAPGQETPAGVWSIWSKQQNAVLRGNNNDGSKYASPVDYWMPIDETGVGIHDSPWQPKYGGDWYKLHGSHGCINTPPAVMAKLYAQVTVGTPVLVF